MATVGDINLKDSEIEELAREIESRKLESIAIVDLGIGIETANNLKVMRQNNFVAFNRDLLVLWRNKNQGINQVQVRKPTQMCNFHYFHISLTFGSVEGYVSLKVEIN